MKKTLCILLCLLLLTACGAPKEDNPSLVNIKEQVQSADKLLGVAYLGYIAGDFRAVQEYTKNQEYTKVYPFIAEIEESHFVQNEGEELYCVVPADNSVALGVYTTKLNEETYQLERAEELQSFSDGQPILICGNVSDIMANLMIVATKGDTVLEYAPSRSGKDGTLFNPEKLLYDFSPYDCMAEFTGHGSELVYDFCGDWACTVTEFHGDTVELNLSIFSDGSVRYFLKSGTKTGSYKGHWFVMSEGRIRMEFGGSIQDSEITDAGKFHTDVDSIYFWDVTDGNLTLTYINGTPFYPNATVVEFPFVPVGESA